MQAKRIPVRLQIFILCGLTLLYAVCYATIKAGLLFAPPLRFAGLRALLGGLALLPLAWVVNKGILPERRLWPWIVALGLLATTISFAGMFLSPGQTTTGVASVLGNTQPLVIILLAALFLGETITNRQYLALILGLAGVVALSYPAWSETQAGPPFGPLLALVAAGGAAAGSVIVKHMAPKRALLSVSAWQLILGSLPLFIWSVAIERHSPILWNYQFTGLLLFLSVPGTAVATAVWYWLIIGCDSVSRLSLFLFLVPLFGFAIGVLFLAEPVGPIEVTGALLAVTGIAVAVVDK